MIAIKPALSVLIPVLSCVACAPTASDLPSDTSLAAVADPITGSGGFTFLQDITAFANDRTAIDFPPPKLTKRCEDAIPVPEPERLAMMTGFKDQPPPHGEAIPGARMHRPLAWSAPIIIGCTIAAPSPSPDPQST